MVKTVNKMFRQVTKTWNPVVGCRHDCTYCWARRLSQTKLKHLPQYKDGFNPKLVEAAFKRRFKDGEVVFVSDMGDLWGDWVPDEWIRRVLQHISKFPNTWFLFLTKNPQRYHDFINEIPSNAILGATIETNRDHIARMVSRAPEPSRRYESMKKLSWNNKIVSIEPILDFDMEVFLEWIMDINPILVYVGYDNYNNKLPEPPLSKTIRLIRELRSNGVNVDTKTIRESWYEKSKS